MNNHVGKAGTPANVRALELIREAFAASPLTQQQIADAADMPRGTFGNVLREERLVSVDLFVRLALALGADIGSWLDELERVVRSDDGGRVLAFPPRPSVGPSTVAVTEEDLIGEPSVAQPDPENNVEGDEEPEGP